MEEGRTKYTTMSKTVDSSEVYHSTEKSDKAPSLQLRTMQEHSRKRELGAAVVGAEHAASVVPQA